jgi:hypothetical protein
MRIVSLTRYLWSLQVLVAAAIILAPAAHAQSNNSKTQQVTLVDPTPRPIDPSLLLGDNPQPGTATQQAAEHRNQKRRELTIWAADELVTLSQHLQAEVTKPKTGPSSADAAANAQKIEQLARNLATALKAP